MKSLRRTIGKLRWEALSAVRQRPGAISGGPSVCITFDDFPRSALEAGGAILASHDARGTYYTAAALMDQDDPNLGPQFTRADIEKLLAAGHELASHTHSHVSGRSVSAAKYLEDAIRGRKLLEELASQPCPHFSYPFGHATFGNKSVIGANFSTCRGIVPGVNSPPADLNLLRANSVYSYSFDPDSIGALMSQATATKGCVIFYTHDVRDNPSRYGCTPAQLDTVLKMARQRGLPIRTIGEAFHRA